MDGKKVLSQLAPYKQGMQIDEVKKKYHLEKIVKLASNENPYGYSERLKHAFSHITDELHIYPDGHTAQLRSALASKLAINENQLIFGNGSDEIVQIISRTFLYPGVNTVMATPTFPQYKHHALIDGADIKEIPTINGYHDLNGMLQAIDKNTKVVWICSPDNPTGTILPPDDFYQFMDQCPKDVLVVLDEAYYEFIDEASRLQALSTLPSYKNLILLRTFSKAYGLAALRIGYGIMAEDIASQLNIVRGPFNTSTIAQQAALIALDDQSFIKNVTTKNREIKQRFEVFLDEIGWHYYPSQTNFILVSTPISGTEVSQYLLKNGFIIRPGELLGYPKTIRITIGTDEDMIQLQHLLKKLHVEINE
ncbi:MAG TPA: histidinol-phosphate transaminase [Candidatus Dormibacteraeota bacterium]|nr:histidinol-phosphate transaminase [Candidatus Dormibacteraeota bacterium]